PIGLCSESGLLSVSIYPIPAATNRWLVPEKGSDRMHRRSCLRKGSDSRYDAGDGESMGSSRKYDSGGGAARGGPEASGGLCLRFPLRWSQVVGDTNLDPRRGRDLLPPLLGHEL